MNTKNKNEVVEEIRKNLFSKYYDEERPYEKIYINVNFIEGLIDEKGLAQVLEAGLLFLSGLSEKEISLLDNGDSGTPKISLKVLFKKALDEGHEEEIVETLVKMYKKGNGNSLFLFDILEKAATPESTPYLERLAVEMQKRTRFSRQGDVKREFIQKNKIRIKDLINRFRPELPLFPLPQH